MHHYFDAIGNYANFKGRARRKQYWWFFLVNTCVNLILGLGIIVLAAFCFVLALDAYHAAVGKMFAILIVFLILWLLYSLYTLIPFMAISVRRFHDTGRSGAASQLYALRGASPLWMQGASPLRPLPEPTYLIPAMPMLSKQYAGAKFLHEMWHPPSSPWNVSQAPARLVLSRRAGALLVSETIGTMASSFCTTAANKFYGNGTKQTVLP